MKLIFSIFLFISFLYAEEKITFLINQKYLCTNLGALVNGTIVPAGEKDNSLKYPIRFYINDKGILHTDAKVDNKFTYDDRSKLYVGENYAIDLSVRDDVRYMINMPIKGDSKGIPFIYTCLKTERWSLY